MANELVKTETPPVTRYSVATLLQAIPDWVDLRLLSAVMQYGYGRPIPAGAGEQLREAALVHRQALSPSDAEERYSVLRGLRSGTILVQETAEEADATLSLLVAHLADVPIDILKAGARAYCNAPGRRFYPKSAGELRAFTNPLMFERQARASHLEYLAKLADQEDARRKRAAECLSPEEFSKGAKEVMRRLSGGAFKGAMSDGG